MTYTPKPVALLDVDDTLLFGTSVMGSPSSTVEQYEKIAGVHKKLLDSIYSSGIRDIYLFTDMTVSASKIVDRYLLIKYLEDVRGFKVHGTVTPPDIFYDRMTADEAAVMRTEINQLKGLDEIYAYVQPTASKFLAKKNEKDGAIEFIPGKMYKEAEQIFLAEALKDRTTFSACLEALSSEEFMNTASTISNTKAVQDITNKSVVGKHLSEYSPAHSKGPLFHQLVMSNSFQKEGFNSVLYADDLKHAVESVSAMVEEQKYSLSVSIIYLPNQNNKKKEGFYPLSTEHMDCVSRHAANPKFKEIYLMNAANQANLLNIDGLMRACELYLKHLKKSTGWDDIETLAGKKYNAVKSMQDKLTYSPDLNKNIEAFEVTFNQNKTLIETRRDSQCSTFLKIVAIILTLGLAATVGLWGVKGREFSKQIDNAVSNLPKRTL